MFIITEVKFKHFTQTDRLREVAKEVAANSTPQEYPGKAPPAVGADKTVIKALGLSGGIFGASPAP
jgi:hypothetical protein